MSRTRVSIDAGVVADEENDLRNPVCVRSLFRHSFVQRSTCLAMQTERLSQRLR